MILGRVVGVLPVRRDHGLYWNEDLTSEGHGIRCVPY